MAAVNKVIVVGHLGADPEMRVTSGGEPVCNLRVATTEVWKDRETGERREHTEWHRFVLYRRLAEIAGQYLRKGSLVYFEGRLRTRKWTDKSGAERWTTEIEASDLSMLGGRNDGGSAGERTGTLEPSASARPTRSVAPVAPDPRRYDEMDDIPF